MHVVVSDLTRSVLQKPSLNECSVEELDALVNRYPYFIPARLMYLRKLQLEDSTLLPEALKQAELWVPETLWLDHLLFGTGSLESGKKEEAISIDLHESDAHLAGEPLVDETRLRTAAFANDHSHEQEVESNEEEALTDVAPGTDDDVEIIEEETETVKDKALEQEEENRQEQEEDNRREQEEDEPRDEQIVYHQEQRHQGFEPGDEGNPVLDYQDHFVAKEHKESDVHITTGEQKETVFEVEDPAIDIEETEQQIKEEFQEPAVDIDETLLEEAEETEPEINEPPVDAPPVDEPPVDEPTVDDPPVDEPPVDALTVDSPPVDKPVIGDEDENDEPIGDEPLNEEDSPQPELRLPEFKIEAIDPSTAELTFEPYHTVDYFASQGIRAKEEEKPVDRFSLQLRSFTDWLKTMKKIAPVETGEPAAPEEKKIEQMAEHSITGREVITEAMAEVWEKQGNRDKAISLYQKLSLLEPGKSTYFAAKIEQLKNS